MIFFNFLSPLSDYIGYGPNANAKGYDITFSFNICLSFSTHLLLLFRNAYKSRPHVHTFPLIQHNNIHACKSSSAVQTTSIIIQYYRDNVFLELSQRNLRKGLYLYKQTSEYCLGVWLLEKGQQPKQSYCQPKKNASPLKPLRILYTQTCSIHKFADKPYYYTFSY